VRREQSTSARPERGEHHRARAAPSAVTGVEHELPGADVIAGAADVASLARARKDLDASVAAPRLLDLRRRRPPLRHGGAGRDGDRLAAGDCAPARGGSGARLADDAQRDRPLGPGLAHVEAAQGEPSTAELSKPGTAPSLRKSAASVRPIAPASGTSSLCQRARADEHQPPGLLQLDERRDHRQSVAHTAAGIVIAMGSIADLLARPLCDLRISVTDRCNLRCGYCMPREVFGTDFAFLERSELLSFEEIERIARLAAGEGVRRIRLTGGEPLLRRGLPRLVAMLARIEGIEDLALTTNGTLLSAHARELAEAGLHRVTVSLDALEQEVFSAMSDTRLPVGRVLAGIDAAHAAGLAPGEGQHGRAPRRQRPLRTGDGRALSRSPGGAALHRVHGRGESNGWRLEQVVPASEILAAIAARWPLRELPATRHGEGRLALGLQRRGPARSCLIHSVTQPFCSGCTRARLSADGRLYTCLFASSGHDLRALLSAGASDAQLAALLREIWIGRADRYSELRGATARASRGARVEMSYIGG